MRSARYISREHVKRREYKSQYFLLTFRIILYFPQYERIASHEKHGVHRVTGNRERWFISPICVTLRQQPRAAVVGDLARSRPRGSKKCAIEIPLITIYSTISRMNQTAYGDAAVGVNRIKVHNCVLSHAMESLSFRSLTREHDE